MASMSRASWLLTSALETPLPIVTASELHLVDKVHDAMDLPCVRFSGVEILARW
jgi:hypothetical protein